MWIRAKKAAWGIIMMKRRIEMSQWMHFSLSLSLSLSRYKRIWSPYFYYGNVCSDDWYSCGDVMREGIFIDIWIRWFGLWSQWGLESLTHLIQSGIVGRVVRCINCWKRIWIQDQRPWGADICLVLYILLNQSENLHKRTVKSLLRRRRWIDWVNHWDE